MSLPPPSPLTDHTAFLEQALRLAAESVSLGGGPFGAVLVSGGDVVATGVNRVTLDCDPTAHAEMVAIRQAAQARRTPCLAGCTLYCSCEPCPMCRGAILWARLDAAYYAADRHDAAAAGFDDARFHASFPGGPDGALFPLAPLRLPSALAPFEAWLAKSDRIPY